MQGDAPGLPLNVMSSFVMVTSPTQSPFMPDTSTDLGNDTYMILSPYFGPVLCFTCEYDDCFSWLNHELRCLNLTH